jgi:crossover junction endodeoxyribonuclease RuvC
MIYIGIDPGKSGGIASINGVTGHAATIKLTETPADVADWLACEKSYPGPIVARIEKVSSSPQMGVTSAFTFGRSFGWLLGVLDVLRIPYEFVTPQKWQKHMGCLTGGDKNVSKAAAQRLWPNLKITHANADALLIAEYCRRVHR